MNPSSAPIDFRTNTQRVPRQIVTSVRKATTRFLGTRAGVVGQVENWEELREAGHNIRLHAINHLDHYLEQMERRVTEAGGHVHWASTAAEAREIVLSIARQHQAKSVVKAKSMATEEIGLNHFLEAAGIRALETDLGEYIVQMAGTGPSHIIVPAVHLTKEDIADLFSEKLHMDAPADPIRLAEIARQKLRQEFIAADMGISGANFLVAETGTVVMVTNEGNGRMCTTLPRVHVAVAGIDKIVPDWESLTVLLKLLARSATGQKITTYTSFITGPRRSAAEHGPQEFHLVLLDNGRSPALRDPLTRETLLCIRCGACLNVCPVYNHVGGHAYGWVYSGPIGSLLSPQLLGTKLAGDLPFASSLCGACGDICPVKLPIPQILLHLRRRVSEGDEIEPARSSRFARWGARVGAGVLTRPWLYRLTGSVLKLVQVPFRHDGWLAALPPPLNRWTMSRPLPAFNARFRGWWSQHQSTVKRS
ncbi:MAG: iron-sulfur cluster-binding protein [Acidobacteriia bacterium]|nr:iron-sulfur cluster-binding protein [Terriglobia bacterium]